MIDDRTVDSILKDAGVDEAYVKELEKKMSQMVSDRAKLDFYNRMDLFKNILAENVPTGLGYRDWLKKVKRGDVMEQLGLAGEKPYYLETVYRTNYGTAHSAARWKAAQESPLVAMLEYTAVIDSRTTEDICKPLNKTIRKKTDSFWSKYMPINHFS